MICLLSDINHNNSLCNIKSLYTIIKSESTPNSDLLKSISYWLFNSLKWVHTKESCWKGFSNSLFDLDIFFITRKYDHIKNELLKSFSDSLFSVESLFLLPHFYISSQMRPYIKRDLSWSRYQIYFKYLKYVYEMNIRKI